MNAEELSLKEALQFWGAASLPFAEGFGGAPLRTPAVEQALKALQEAAAFRGISLITGEPGVGKSSLVAWWSAQLDAKLYRPLIITHSALTGIGLMATILHKLGKSPRQRREHNLQLLESVSSELGRITPVLVLDEAQNYHRSALEEMRLLFSLNLARQSLFALVLLGDQYLLDTLRMQSYRALYSRISAHTTLPRLGREQIAPYLEHALAQSGQPVQIFSPPCIDMLAEASAGVPRTLNFLARHAWHEAAKRRSNQILPEHLRPALQSVPAAQDKLHST